jgi:hypothetical protein
VEFVTEERVASDPAKKAGALRSAALLAQRFYNQKRGNLKTFYVRKYRAIREIRAKLVAREWSFLRNTSVTCENRTSRSKRWHIN